MKKVLFTAVAAALSIGVFAAEIKLNKKVIDRKSHKLYRYDISGFKYKQSFNYIVFSKKDGTETLANNSGNICGLTYGWFGSGMISAVANNKVQLLAQPPKIEEGKDSIKFNFDGQGFKSELTFKFVPDSDIVIGKLKVEPVAALRKLVVNFFSVPGHNGNTIEGKKPLTVILPLHCAVQNWKTARPSSLIRIRKTGSVFLMNTMTEQVQAYCFMRPIR